MSKEIQNVCMILLKRRMRYTCTMIHSFIPTHVFPMYHTICILFVCVSFFFSVYVIRSHWTYLLYILIFFSVVPAKIHICHSSIPGKHIYKIARFLITQSENSGGVIFCFGRIIFCCRGGISSCYISVYDVIDNVHSCGHNCIRLLQCAIKAKYFDLVGNIWCYNRL